MKTISVKTNFEVLSPIEFWNKVKNDPNRSVPAYRLYNTKKSEVTSKKISGAVSIFYSPTWYWMGNDDTMRWTLSPVNYYASYDEFTDKNVHSLRRELNKCGIDCFLVKVDDE